MSGLSVHVDPLSGRPLLIPSQKSSSGGGGGGASNGLALAMIVTSDPADGFDGQIIYNTTDSTLKVWANGQWNSISGGTAGGTFDFIDGTDMQFIDGTYADFIS